jgi:hypothetical protein
MERHSSNCCERASRVLIGLAKWLDRFSYFFQNSLSRRNDPLAVLVIETALGGPTGETLPARLLPITANLAPLAFGTSVGCCDAFASRVA